jgi:hypothetical protein
VNDQRWASRRGGYDATEWPGWLQLRLQLATFAVVRHCSPSPNAQFKAVHGTSTNRAERIIAAWQCGGQGFEPPQLSHSNRPFSFRESGLSRLGATAAGYLIRWEADSELPDVPSRVGRDVADRYARSRTALI